MPVYEGGDTAILGYVARQTKYPEEAKVKGIQGKVMVKFVVEKDGTVSNVKVLKSADPLLDAEAVKVVESLPAFAKPGKVAGKNVRVYFVLPITFCSEIIFLFRPEKSLPVKLKTDLLQSQFFYFKYISK